MDDQLRSHHVIACCMAAMSLLLICGAVRAGAQTHYVQIDTARVAAMIVFPVNELSLAKPVETYVRLEIDTGGTVARVVGNAAQRDVFERALEDLAGKVVGEPARHEGCPFPASVGLTVRFSVAHVQGSPAGRIQITTIVPQGSVWYNVFPLSCLPWLKAQAQARGEALPDSDEFVPVEVEPTYDEGQLTRNVHYPDVARQAGFQGTVVVRVLVGSDGRVITMFVDRAANPILDDAALDAVAHVTFTPARKGKKAVAVWLQIPIVFKLQ